MNPTARLFAAAACFALWLTALLLGFALGGAIHLVAVAGLLLVPWRAGRDAPPSPPHPTEEP